MKKKEKGGGNCLTDCSILPNASSVVFIKLSFAKPYLRFVSAHFIMVTGFDELKANMRWRGINSAYQVDTTGRLMWTGRCSFGTRERPLHATLEYLFPK